MRPTDDQQDQQDQQVQQDPQDQLTNDDSSTTPLSSLEYGPIGESTHFDANPTPNPNLVTPHPFASSIENQFDIDRAQMFDTWQSNPAGIYALHNYNSIKMIGAIAGPAAAEDYRKQADQQAQDWHDQVEAIPVSQQHWYNSWAPRALANLLDPVNLITGIAAAETGGAALEALPFAGSAISEASSLGARVATRTVRGAVMGASAGLAQSATTQAVTGKTNYVSDVTQGALYGGLFDGIIGTTVGKLHSYLKDRFANPDIPEVEKSLSTEQLNAVSSPTVNQLDTALDITSKSTNAQGVEDVITGSFEKNKNASRIIEDEVLPKYDHQLNKLDGQIQENMQSLSDDLSDDKNTQNIHSVPLSRYMNLKNKINDYEPMDTTVSKGHSELLNTVDKTMPSTGLITKLENTMNDPTLSNVDKMDNSMQKMKNEITDNEQTLKRKTISNKNVQILTKRNNALSKIDESKPNPISDSIKHLNDLINDYQTLKAGKAGTSNLSKIKSNDTIFDPSNLISSVKDRMQSDAPKSRLPDDPTHTPYAESSKLDQLYNRMDDYKDQGIVTDDVLKKFGLDKILETEKNDNNIKEFYNIIASCLTEEG